MPLAVSLARNNGLDDTLLDQIHIAPVFSLGAFSINSGCGIRDSGPERWHELATLLTEGTRALTSSAEVLIPSVPLGVEDLLTASKGIVVSSLQAPFADEVGELSLVGNELCLTTNSRVNVVSIDTGRGEVVDMWADDDSVSGVEVRCPEFGAFEVVLDDQRDARVDLLNACQDTLQILVDPLRALISETRWGTKAREISVRGFVERRYGESVESQGGGFDVVQHTVHCLPGVVQVGLVEEPSIMSECLSDIE